MSGKSKTNFCLNLIKKTFLVKNAWNSFLYGTVLTYSTVKVVQIPNTYIAIIHRILQLIIFAYIIG